MTKNHTIVCYAANDTMGANTDRDCELFRSWAKSQIKTAYPDYNVDVLDEDSLVGCYTSDEENRDEICDFVQMLWNRCDWDFLKN